VKWKFDMEAVGGGRFAHYHTYGALLKGEWRGSFSIGNGKVLTMLVTRHRALLGLEPS